MGQHRAARHRPRATPAIRIDAGDADEFRPREIRCETFVDAARQAGYRVDYHLHPGYDHSYYTIASYSARTSPSTPKHWGWGNRKTNRRPALGDIHNYRRPAG